MYSTARYRAELWDKLEAEGGKRLAVLGPLVSGTATVRLDNQDALTLRALESTGWVGSVDLGAVVRLVSPTSDVSEWPISQTERIRGAGQDVVRVDGLSVLGRLGETGLIADVSTGGQSWRNLGGVSVPPTQYMVSYVIPSAQLYAGSSFFETGTVDSTADYDIAWDRWTPLQLLQALSTRSGTEIEVARSGSSAYAVNLWSERGSSATKRVFRIGRQMLKLDHQRRANGFATVVIPSGLVPTGGVESASMGWAAWRIESISGSDITIADPAGGPDPIQYNDQVTGFYVLKPDAALAQITSASTGQVLKLADATGLSTGEHIEIRKDANGVLLLELTNSTAVTDYGRRIATVEDTALRGERNIVANGMFSQWAATTAEYGTWATANTTTSLSASTSVPLYGLGANEAISTDDLLLMSGHYYAPQQPTSAVTAGSSGFVTVSVGTSAGGVNINSSEPVLVLHQASPNQISGKWHQYFDPTAPYSVSATVDVAASSALSLTLSGLTTSDWLYAGDQVATTDGTVQGYVGALLVPGTSGTADVRMLPNAYTNAPSLTLSSGTALTITRPDLGTGLLGAVSMPLNTTGIHSDSYTVRYDATLPVLWAKAAYVERASTSGAAVLNVNNGNTSTAIGTVTANVPSSSDAGTWVGEAMAVQVTLTSDTPVSVEFVPPDYAPVSGQIDVNYSCYLAYLQLTLGSDPSVPPIDGSYGNALWQRANAGLIQVSQDPSIYTISMEDLTRDASYVADDESLTLGGTVRVYDPDWGLDSDLRITSITHDLIDPGKSQVLLAAVPKRLTDALALGPKTSVTVAVNVSSTNASSTASGGAGGGTGTQTSTASAITYATGQVNTGEPNIRIPRSPGAPRITPPPSSAGGAGSTELTKPVPYVPPTLKPPGQVPT